MVTAQTEHLTCQPPSGPSPAGVYGAKLPAGQWDSGKATLALQPRLHYWAQYPKWLAEAQSSGPPKKGGTVQDRDGAISCCHPPCNFLDFIHFPLNYVLFKMVLFGFFMGSCLLTPSLCPR